MLVNTEVFIKTDQLYEFRLEIIKDVRMASVHLQVMITEGVPPIMGIV